MGGLEPESSRNHIASARCIEAKEHSQHPMDESRHEEKRTLLGESKNDRDVVDAKERPKNQRRQEQVLVQEHAASAM